MTNRERKCREWPLRLLVGDRVRARGRNARVRAAPLKEVPKGYVPIEYEGRPIEKDCVPADDIELQ